MKRKLITVNEATPAGKQIKKPCSDCPWARDALNGWLGGNATHEWIIFAHGESRIECHVHPDVQCAGAAIYRANVCKSPRDRSQLVLPPNTKLVFANAGEFIAHHAKTPEAKLKAKLAGKPSGGDCSRCDGSGDDPDGGRCDCCGGTGYENEEPP